jgi:hypothetical protein
MARTPLPARETRALPDPSLRFGEIGFVDFEPDKLFYAASLSSNGRVSDSEERIEHCLRAGYAVKLDAPLRQLHRKRRRMRSLLRAALDCFVWNEPSVAAATEVAPARMRPARNIALILIRNSEGQPVNFDATGFREMENVFVAIV